MPPDYTITSNTKPKAERLPGRIRVSDLAGKPVPERRWAVPDWIPDLNVTSLYGDGGTGKSLLAMQLATAMATGRDFLNIPLAPRKTLYLSCEDDEAEMHRRQAHINDVMGVDYGDLSDNLDWYVRPGEDSALVTFGRDGRIRQTAFAKELFAHCKAEGVRLLIIDTVADTFGGNEIIRAEVRGFLAILRRLALDIDGAVVLLAHPSVAGMKDGHGYSGSTAWRGSVRSLLTFETEDGEDADPDRRILTRRKANYAKAGTTLPVRYLGGAFVAEHSPVEQPTMMDALTDEMLFLRGLEKALATGQCPSASKSAEGYAPRFVLRSLGKDGQSVTVKRLEGAMQRLFARGEIIVQHHWKGSKPLTPKDYDLSKWGKK